MTKQEIINKLHEDGGFFITDKEFHPDYDLDGEHASKYLESKGFKVIDYRDMGSCGLVKVKYGKEKIEMSTNGYIYLVFDKVRA